MVNGALRTLGLTSSYDGTVRRRFPNSLVTGEATSVCVPVNRMRCAVVPSSADESSTSRWRSGKPSRKTPRNSTQASLLSAAVSMLSGACAV
jgi:hypothetical protein